MRVLALLMTLMVGLTPAEALQPQPQIQQQGQVLPASEVCSIEGTVVRAVDSQPLKKARVYLRRAEGVPGRGSQRDQPIAATTDAEGRFRLQEIPPARYRFFVERNGFVRQEYGQRTPSGQGSILTLTPGQRITQVLFRLMPAAVIAGRVYDEDGEPAPWVQIQAMRYSYIRGQRQFTPAGSSASNDRGEYRIFGLAPGKYYLSAMPGAGGFMFSGGGVILQSGSGDAEDENYSPTYYPSTTDPARATPLELKAGDEVLGIDIALVLQRTYRVRGRVFNTVAKTLRNEVMVMLMPRTGLRFFPFREREVTKEDGSFELRSVAPGSYYLVATAYGGERQYSARQPIEVGQSDLEGISLVIAGGVDLDGQLRAEGNLSIQENDIQVYLRPAEEEQMFFFGSESVMAGADGTFTLKDVSPGSYRVIVGGLPPDAYVKSIRLGEQDALERGLNVGAGKPSATLEVTVSGAGARVEGLVLNKESVPASGTMVALIPEPRLRERNELFKTTTTDQYGRFLLRGIAPGTYRLFAWEEVERGAWMDPEFLMPIESKGVELKLGAGEIRSAELVALPPK